MLYRTETIARNEEARDEKQSEAPKRFHSSTQRRFSDIKVRAALHLLSPRLLLTTLIVVLTTWDLRKTVPASS